MELNGMGFVASGLSKSSSADPTSNISKDGAMVSSLLISKFITFINPDASSPSPPPGVKETSANPEATSRPADPVEKGGRPLQGEEVGVTVELAGALGSVLRTGDRTCTTTGTGDGSHASQCPSGPRGPYETRCTLNNASAIATVRLYGLRGCPHECMHESVLLLSDQPLDRVMSGESPRPALPYSLVVHVRNATLSYYMEYQTVGCPYHRHLVLTSLPRTSCARIPCRGRTTCPSTAPPRCSSGGRMACTNHFIVGSSPGLRRPHRHQSSLL
eukprot:scaffold395_cov383-Prasinococcus_capsulatus_cf.AAC.10